ncbi:MAG: O-antigen ligase family protein [Acidipropionibacterium sp.]|jgi:teichuronic acid biosynthesis protein TuaE|nr:O-antigen ligase family protein [Acidipropionibacterium sp.]
MTRRLIAWCIGALPAAALLGPWAGVGPLFAYRLVVVCLVVLAVLAGRRSRASLTILGLAALWLGTGAATALTVGPGRQWSELAAVALGLAGVWSIARLRDHDPVRRLARGWAVAVAISLPVAAWEVATARHLPGYLNGVWKNHPGLYRQPATWLTNPNLYAVLTAIAVPLLALRSRHEKGVWRWAMIVLAVLSAVLLTLTSGRAAMLALVCAAAVRVLASRRWRWALLAGAVVGLVVLLALRGPELALSWHRVIGVIVHHSNEGPSSLSVRSALVAVGLHLVRLHPWLGTGPGGFEASVRAGGLPWTLHGKVDPHCGVLEIASQYGLIVSAALAAVMVASAVIVVRDRRRGATRWWVLGYLVALPILSFANSTYLVQSVTQLSWALAAALVCWAASGTAGTAGRTGPAADRLSGGSARGDGRNRPEWRGTAKCES